jgi:hypothetical protein
MFAVSGWEMQALTYLILVVGVAGFWLALKFKVGWMVCIVQEALYVAYGVMTRQYAFCFHGVLFAMVFFRNWRKARDKEPWRAWRIRPWAGNEDTPED